MGALLGFMPGFQIAARFTGGTLGPLGAAAAITGGILVSMLLLRPWGEFGKG